MIALIRLNGSRYELGLRHSRRNSNNFPQLPVLWPKQSLFAQNFFFP